MNRALSTAASGMEAQELKLDIIANNLANVNTTGFKKSRGEFQDMLYDNLRAAGAVDNADNQVPTGMQVGQGVRPVATMRQFTLGDLQHTGNSLDLAIEGDGFFRVLQPNGEVAYSRDGTLKNDSRGRLVTADGYPLDPPLVIPADAQKITFAPDGRVTVTVAGEPQPVDLGNVELATFINPAGLEARGRNLYLETAASGPAQIVAPGSDGSGTLAQGFVEMSNVKVVEEMIDLIAAQRAYETNSKVIRAADDMLRTTSSLRV